MHHLSGAVIPVSYQRLPMDWKNREGVKPFGTQREYHWIQNLRYEDRRMAHSIADTSTAAGAASRFIADNGSYSASYSLVMVLVSTL